MAVKVEETKSKKGIVVLIIIVAILVAFLVAIGIALTDSLGIKLEENNKYIEISENESAAQIAADLKKDGIIKYPYMFRLQAIVGGYDGHFQPGSAYIESGMSYNQILDMLITPSRNTTKVIIPAGCEIREIAIKLCELNITTWDEFYEALYNVTDYDYPFLWGLPSRASMMEGYLYPATYEIPVGTSAHDIVDLMLSTFNTQFKEEYYQKAADLGLSVDEVITIASLVQRESNEGCDLNRIAGVYINKKNAGMFFDSTASVQYALNERKPVISIADTKLDSPYNTFVYPGLPIGPICNPSIAAIEAVLNYTPSDEYYFAMTENGEQIFSTNHSEFINLIESTTPAVEVDTDVIKNQDDKIGATAEAEEENSEAEGYSEE